MNNVTINTQEMSLPVWSGAVCSFATKVLDELNCVNWELSILFCGNKTIRGLNNHYLNKDEPTDILSFNLGETIKDGGREVYLPGDIIISLEMLHENAQYFKISEDEELRRLLIHGILHLNGMDHETIESGEPMLALQESILEKFKNERIIPCGGKD